MTQTFPCSQFHYSDLGLARTEHWEGESSHAYYDCGGVLTNGMGHTGPDVHFGDIWTQEQINHFAKIDLANAEAQVHALLGETLLDQNQYDALVDFEFNTGHLAGSTLLRLILAGDMAGADGQFQLWDHVKGQVIEGLLTRRLAEAQLFES